MVTASTKFKTNYIYSSEQTVASDVEGRRSTIPSGLVDRLGMGLTWGLFDISNGEVGHADMTHNEEMDMFRSRAVLSYKLDAMGGTLTPSSAELTLNQVDDMPTPRSDWTSHGGPDRSGAGDRVRAACGRYSLR